MKVLLVCNAGMSTSMLMQKMQEVVNARGVNVSVDARGYRDALRDFVDYDVVLVGPQVRHQFEQLKKKTKGVCACDLINMKDYGMMDGEKVLDQAIRLYEEG